MNSNQKKSYLIKGILKLVLWAAIAGVVFILLWGLIMALGVTELNYFPGSLIMLCIGIVCCIGYGYTHAREDFARYRGKETGMNPYVITDRDLAKLSAKATHEGLLYNLREVRKLEDQIAALDNMQNSMDSAQYQTERDKYQIELDSVKRRFENCRTRHLDNQEKGLIKMN